MRKHIFKGSILWFIGGSSYVLVELLWRGHSHISMFILGGVCFLLIGKLNEYLPWEMGLVQQSLLGAGVITILEFLTGIVVNVILGLDVWNYSHLPLNIMGQICLPFFVLWIPVACAAILLDDHIRYWMFDEEKPHYTLI